MINGLPSEPKTQVFKKTAIKKNSRKITPGDMFFFREKSSAHVADEKLGNIVKIF
jgi:hypothetical protein